MAPNATDPRHFDGGVTERGKPLFFNGQIGPVLVKFGLLRTKFDQTRRSYPTSDGTTEAAAGKDWGKVIRIDESKVEDHIGEMVKFARDLRFNRHLVPVAATLTGSLLANMAVGFAAGMAVHYLLLGKEHRHADAQR